MSIQNILIPRVSSSEIVNCHQLPSIQLESLPHIPHFQRRHDRFLHSISALPGPEAFQPHAGKLHQHKTLKSPRWRWKCRMLGRNRETEKHWKIAGCFFKPLEKPDLSWRDLNFFYQAWIYWVCVVSFFQGFITVSTMSETSTSQKKQLVKKNIEIVASSQVLRSLEVYSALLFSCWGCSSLWLPEIFNFFFGLFCCSDSFWIDKTKT